MWKPRIQSTVISEHPLYAQQQVLHAQAWGIREKSQSLCPRAAHAEGRRCWGLDGRCRFTGLNTPMRAHRVALGTQSRAGPSFTQTTCRCFSETTPDSLRGTEESRRSPREKLGREGEPRQRKLHVHRTWDEMPILREGHGCVSRGCCTDHTRISEQGSWMPRTQKINRGCEISPFLPPFADDSSGLLPVTGSRHWWLSREGPPKGNSCCCEVSGSSNYVHVLPRPGSQFCSVKSSFHTFIFKQTHLLWTKVQNSWEPWWQSIKPKEIFLLATNCSGAHLYVYKLQSLLVFQWRGLPITVGMLTNHLSPAKAGKAL